MAKEKDWKDALKEENRGREKPYKNSHTILYIKTYHNFVFKNTNEIRKHFNPM